MEFDVLIEIPRGSRNKYEVGHHSGLIRLDRTLFTAELEPGKSVAGASWADRAAAEAEVEASRRRLRAAPGPQNG
jgi:inorganic pyrophosphatase